MIFCTYVDKNDNFEKRSNSYPEKKFQNKIAKDVPLSLLPNDLERLVTPPIGMLMTFKHGL